MWQEAARLLFPTPLQYERHRYDDGDEAKHQQYQLRRVVVDERHFGIELVEYEKRYENPGQYEADMGY
jgi:hypothetical protein